MSKKRNRLLDLMSQQNQLLRRFSWWLLQVGTWAVLVGVLTSGVGGGPRGESRAAILLWAGSALLAIGLIGYSIFLFIRSHEQILTRPRLRAIWGAAVVVLVGIYFVGSARKEAAREREKEERKNLNEEALLLVQEYPPERFLELDSVEMMNVYKDVLMKADPHNSTVMQWVHVADQAFSDKGW